MTTSLGGALPQRTIFKKTELKHVSVGANRGYFIGLGETFEETSNDPCRACSGQKFINNNNEPCKVCEGSGRKRTTKVVIRYQFKVDEQIVTEEEWVTYMLSGPGKLKNGSPKSASTLWSRMRALSGLTELSEISAWYDALEKPIKIPIELMVLGNDDGNGMHIAQLRKLNPRSAAPPPTPEDDDIPY